MSDKPCPSCGACVVPDICACCGICKNCNKRHSVVTWQIVPNNPYPWHQPIVPPYEITCTDNGANGLLPTSLGDVGFTGETRLSARDIINASKPTIMPDGWRA